MGKGTMKPPSGILVAEKIRKAYRLTRPHKYHAKRTDGYASKREANRAAELAVLERQGLIGPVTKQPAFNLLAPAPELGYARALRYIADFRYIDLVIGKTVVEDVKGL